MKTTQFKTIIISLVLTAFSILSLVACSASNETTSVQIFDTETAYKNTVPSETIPPSTISSETTLPETESPTVPIETAEPVPTNVQSTTEEPDIEEQLPRELYDINVQYEDGTVGSYEMELTQIIEKDITIGDFLALSDYISYISDTINQIEDDLTYKFIKATFSSSDGTILNVENLYVGDDFSFLHNGLPLRQWDFSIRTSDREDSCFVAEFLSLPNGKEGSFLHLYYSASRERIGDGVIIEGTVSFIDGKPQFGRDQSEFLQVHYIEITKTE